MRVDRLLELFQRLLICRRDDAHRAAQFLISRPHRLIDGEEAAQVDIAFQRHRDVLQRNGEGRGIGAVGDLLTGAERRQDQLDRVRA